MNSGGKMSQVVYALGRNAHIRPLRYGVLQIKGRHAIETVTLACKISSAKVENVGLTPKRGIFKIWGNQRPSNSKFCKARGTHRNDPCRCATAENIVPTETLNFSDSPCGKRSRVRRHGNKRPQTRSPLSSRNGHL